MTKTTHRQFEHAVALILRDSVKRGEPPDDWDRSTARFLHNPQKMMGIPLEPCVIKTRSSDRRLREDARIAVNKTQYVTNPIALGLSQHTHGLKIQGVVTKCETAAVSGLCHVCTCGRVIWDER